MIKENYKTLELSDVFGCLTFPFSLEPWVIFKLVHQVNDATISTTHFFNEKSLSFSVDSWRRENKISGSRLTCTRDEKQIRIFFCSIIFSLASFMCCMYANYSKGPICLGEKKNILVKLLNRVITHKPATFSIFKFVNKKKRSGSILGVVTDSLRK